MTNTEIMRDFLAGTGDVCWEDYGGNFYRDLGDRRFHFIRVMNWQDTCGSDAPEDATHNVKMGLVELSDLSMCVASLASRLRMFAMHNWQRGASTTA